MPGTTPKHRLVMNIGELPVAVHTDDSRFADMLRERYGEFVEAETDSAIELEVALTEVAGGDPEEDMQVSLAGTVWHMQRGDFRAEFDAATGRGRVRQTANPYAIDSALRVIHTLMLSREGGFLLHAASAIREGKAFLFSGVSGAGKTTISRLAPAGVTLLTDEVSYVRRGEQGYVAHGTPFAGELARIGKKVSAPVEKLFLLEKGGENRMSAIESGEAVRLLMRNILFFAQDASAVNRVFESACDFAARVPVYVLSFYPDARVWDLIR